MSFNIYGLDSDVYNWSQVDLSSNIDCCVTLGQPSFTVKSKKNTCEVIGWW